MASGTRTNKRALGIATPKRSKRRKANIDTSGVATGGLTGLSKVDREMQRMRDKTNIGLFRQGHSVLGKNKAVARDRRRTYGTKASKTGWRRRNKRQQAYATYIDATRPELARDFTGSGGTIKPPQ